MTRPNARQKIEYKSMEDQHAPDLRSKKIIIMSKILLLD